jgi:hypothetical protein
MRCSHDDAVPEDPPEIVASIEYFVLGLTFAEESPNWEDEGSKPWADVPEVASSHHWRLAYAKTEELAAAIAPLLRAEVILAPSTSHERAFAIASTLRSVPGVQDVELEAHKWNLPACSPCIRTDVFMSRPRLFVALLVSFYLFDPVEIGAANAWLVKNNADEYAGEVRDLIEFLPTAASEHDVVLRVSEICEAGGVQENIDRLARTAWATWRALGPE